MRTCGEFVFAETQNSNNNNAIILSPRKGPEMRYGARDIMLVDFPGEYDIRGHAVICYATGDELHYIITVDGKRYAIIQNSQVLSKESFDQIDVWVVTDQSIKDYIEREEREGKVELLIFSPYSVDLKV